MIKMAKFEEIPIEKVGSYWNRRPCNIRHSPKTVGSREYFDEVEHRKYFVEPHIPRFAEFDRWKGKTVLEIGCGIGADTINFARAGAEVTAVDLSEKSLELAEKRARVYGLDNITFYCANAENLSAVVPPKSYDLVYSFGVVHHTPRPENIIAQIRDNYIKPGGTLKIMVYHRYSWKVFWIMITYGHGAFWRLDELVARHSEAQTGCPVTYLYSRRRIASLLKGFEIRNASVEHIFPYRISDYVRYDYVRNWYFDLLPTKLFHWLEHQIGWHLCVTAKAKG